MSVTTLWFVLGIWFLIGIIVATRHVIHINKSKMNLFDYYMNARGPEDVHTINALGEVMKELLESQQGFTVESLSIVHEVGHKYQCFVTSGGQNYTIEVIANAGNVHYTIINGSQA